MNLIAHFGPHQGYSVGDLVMLGLSVITAVGILAIMLVGFYRKRYGFLSDPDPGGARAGSERGPAGPTPPGDDPELRATG